MNGFDDELRDALAGGAPPPPDFADVRRRARTAQRRGRALAGSGLVAVVLAAGGLAWALASDDDERTNVITDSPDDPTTTSTSTSTSLAAVEPVPPGPRPTTALIVTTDGDLRTIDVATGATVAELGRYEPGHDEETGMSWFIDDVSRTADGSAAFVSRCCEPAGGSMSVLPTDGSVYWDDDGLGEHSFGSLWLVRPAPTSGRVAVSMYSGVEVTTPIGPTPEEFDDPDVPWPTAAAGAEGMAWSPDGRRLVWTGPETGEGGDGGELFVAEVRGEDDVVVHDPLAPPDGAVWRQPTVRRDGMVVVVESTSEGDRAVVLDPITGESVAEFPLDGEVVSLGYDPSGTWLLVVYDGGRLVGMGGGEVVEIATEVARADW